MGALLIHFKDWKNWGFNFIWSTDVFYNWLKKLKRRQRLKKEKKDAERRIKPMGKI